MQEKCYAVPYNPNNPFLALPGQPAPKPLIDVDDHLFSPQSTPVKNIIDEDSSDSSEDDDSEEPVPPPIPHGPVEW